jgi:polar amino acid transport system permease protein
MELDWSAVVSSLPLLLKGAWFTLSVSLLAILLGTAVGIALTLALQAGIAPLRIVVRVYISFVRGTPLFIQIFIVYFVLPRVGLNVSNFVAGVLALSLNSAAYISEMLRGGLTALPRGQIEAARAVGMSELLIWRRIILPQIFVFILPPLTIEFTGLVKASSLLMIIGVIELTRTAQQLISTTYRSIEIWLTVGAIYFVLCFGLGLIARKVESATRFYRS